MKLLKASIFLLLHYAEELCFQHSLALVLHGGFAFNQCLSTGCVHIGTSINLVMLLSYYHSLLLLKIITVLITIRLASRLKNLSTFFYSLEDMVGKILEIKFLNLHSSDTKLIQCSFDMTHQS